MRHGLLAACAVVLFSSFFVVIPACSGQEGKGAPELPPAGAVAVVGDHVITEQELESFVASALAPLREQEFRIKTEGVNNLVFRHLLELEAAKAGLSAEEFHRQEVVDKAGDPSDSEIEETVNRFRSQLPRDEREARGRVFEFLKGQKVQEREQVLRAEWMNRHPVRVLLDPPRVTVPEAPAQVAKGPADAPVVIVEFSDYACPYCKRAQDTMRQVREAYGDKVRLEYRHFPLSGFTRKAAEASLCAGDQGRFWELHARLFAHQGELNLEAIRSAAQAVELDMEAFTSCLDGGEKASQIARDRAVAQSLGVSGTPAFFVNGRNLSGAQPFAAFKEIIDDELRRAGVEP